VALLIPLIAAATAAAVDAVLTAPPSSTDPGFIDVILASRGVIASIRVAIVFAAAYVVASTVWLVHERRFLVRLGPVEVSEEAPTLDADNKLLRERVQRYEKTMAELQFELADKRVAVSQNQRGKPGGER
jgi:hypothetical protein